MYNLLIIFLFLLFLFYIYKKNSLNKIRNNSLIKFKNRFISKESNIEKIFSRQDEKTSLDPNIDIVIGIYENEYNVNKKLNIHRARLNKFNKSKLNGEMIYMDKEQKIFKNINGNKHFI